MSLTDELQTLAKGCSATWKEKKRGRYVLTKTVAERKVFLSKKRLVYSAGFRLDERKKELVFSEMLRETSVGLLASSGFGIQTESWNTLSKAGKRTIEEQSTLFGEKYNYRFDFSLIRRQVQEICERHGYRFRYTIF